MPLVPASKAHIMETFRTLKTAGVVVGCSHPTGTLRCGAIPNEWITLVQLLLSKPFELFKDFLVKLSKKFLQIFGKDLCLTFEFKAVDLAELTLVYKLLQRLSRAILAKSVLTVEFNCRSVILGAFLIWR